MIRFFNTNFDYGTPLSYPGHLLLVGLGGPDGVPGGGRGHGVRAEAGLHVQERGSGGGGAGGYGGVGGPEGVKEDGGDVGLTGQAQVGVG